MGVSKQQAEENHRAMVDAATKLFRERGVDGVGLAELMKHAGFTQGGFYNHFKSKDALVTKVIETAMAETAEEFREVLSRPAPVDTTCFERQVDYYLSEGHRDDIECGCAVAGFVCEVARLGEEAQSRFTTGLNAAFSFLTELVAVRAPPAKPEKRRRRREQAISLYCQMMGALLLSRSVRIADGALSNEILAVGRNALVGSSKQKLSRRPGMKRKPKRR
jgi:TetR/AcrR family transcriptional repressor of nem operon